MESNEMQTARMSGVTYRSEDYRFVVVLNGDEAIVRVSDGMGWSGEGKTTIEAAWVTIARRGLKLVSTY